MTTSQLVVLLIPLTTGSSALVAIGFQLGRIADTLRARLDSETIDNDSRL